MNCVAALFRRLQKLWICASTSTRVLHFPDPETGRALLLGTDNAIEAFMRGDFRSDGYLILVFQLLNVFHNSG